MDNNLKICFDIISNKNNRILFSSDLIEFIEAELKGNPNQLQLFKGYLASHQSFFLRITRTNQKTVDTIKTSLYNNYNSLTEVQKKDTFIELSILQAKSLNKVNSVILEQSVKPNFHYIASNVARLSPNPTTLRHSDFRSNTEIETILENICNISRNVDRVLLFDRQLNLDHKLFSHLINKAHFHFYTARLTNPKDATYIKEKLKRVTVYCGNRNIIHERRLLINNLIVEFDDDFQNIDISRNTWKIDITYCGLISGIYKDKAKRCFRPL